MSKRISKAFETVQKAMRAVRQDGFWSNSTTGLGTIRDKMTLASFAMGARLEDDQADILYAEDDIAARMCDLMPEEAMRKGVQCKIAPGEDESEDAIDVAREQESEFDTIWDRLNANEKIVEAATWGNVFGGAVILIGGLDGATGDALAEPLNEENIKSVAHLNVIDKRYLTPQRYYDDPNEARYTEPMIYRFTAPYAPSTGYTGVYDIHESRLLVFGGVRTSINRRYQNGGWNDSLLQRVHRVLMQFGVSWDTLAHIISDANQGVFKMSGLIEALAADDAGIIQTRMELLDTQRSAVRALVLDADGEEFQRQNFSWSGIREPYDLLMYRVAAAARVPVTKLMGRSPAGQNSTGEHDDINFRDQAESYRNEKLVKNIERLAYLILKSNEGPTGGREPEKWRIEFPSLWTPTAKEKAEIYEINSRADVANVNAGILLPEEVALSRFGLDGYSDEIHIDMQAREALEIEKEENKNMMEEQMQSGVFADEGEPEQSMGDDENEYE